MFGYKKIQCGLILYAISFNKETFRPAISFDITFATSFLQKEDIPQLSA
jgi:hypothetical protein